MINFICKCGHKEDEHNWDPYSAFFGCCEIKSNDPIKMPTLYYCKCDRFKRDNLRYLEDLYEQTM